MSILNSFFRLFSLLLIAFCPILTLAEVSWLYSGNQIIEQNVEEGARGWIFTVKSSGSGLLQCTAIAQVGTNVTGAATSQRLIDLNASIKNSSGVEYKINQIATGLFKNNKTLDTIILPSALVAIPESAFRADSGGSSLKCIIITGNKIGSIGTFAFYKNTSITNIIGVINGLTSIGDGAFHGCSNLKGPIIINSPSLTFQSSKYGIFQSCSSLEGFIVNGDVVGALPSNLFHLCSKLKTVQLSSNPTNLITSIGSAAFYGCSALTDFSPMVFSKASVINDAAFTSCSKLKGDFVFQAPTLTINTSKNTYGAFSGCASITSFKVEGTLIKTLPKKLFHSCSSLKSIQVSGSDVSPITDIDTTAVYGCSSLTNFSPMVFNSLISVGDQAFDSTPNLKGDFVIDHTNPVRFGKEALGYPGCSFDSVFIKAPVSAIGDFFLAKSPTLKNCHFGSTIASPNKYFLYDIKTLNVVTIPYRPASFGENSFGNTGTRQMVIRISKHDSNGWLNDGMHTPRKNFSQAINNEWLNLSEGTKVARGWDKMRFPIGTSLGLSTVQWLVTIPEKGTLMTTR